MTTQSILLHDVRLILDAAGGSLSLVRQGRQLKGITAHATVRVAGELRRIDLLAQASLADGERGDLRRALIQADHGAVRSELQLEVGPGDPWIRVVVLLSAAGAPLTVEEITPFAVHWSQTHLASEVAVARWWVTPANGWDRPGTRPLGGAVHPDDSPTIAFDTGGAYAPSGAALTLGHLLPSRWINRIEADVHGLELRCQVGVTIPAQGALTSDALLIDPVRPITDALSSLAGRHHGRRQPAESASHWGWNAWDYHTDKVTEADIERAIDAIKAHPWMASRLRYLIVDDFWQDLAGDWMPGSRFGSIQRVATTIQAAGFTPGIWSAPFFVDRHSQLLTGQPDIALKMKDGQYYSHCMGCDPPWGDRIYLDPTHPAVPEHLYRLYRRLSQWGFGYFKTDFLHNAISPVFPGDQAKYRDQIRYHNPGLGLVRAHRTCMEAIRAAIGPDAFWLGCGTHYASGAGLMDSTRISGDMRVHYPNLIICARSAIFDFHLHGGAFLIDPDFAVFRGRDTVLPGGLEVPPMGTKPYERLRGDSGPTFDLAEARLWGAVLLMSGGMVTLSDRIDGLNQAGLDIIRLLLEHGGGEAARPLDIFSPLPRLWRKQHQDTTYLLLANWGDDGPAVIDLPDDLPIGTIYDDLWGGEPLSVSPGQGVIIPPHGHRLLRQRR